MGRGSTRREGWWRMRCPGRLTLASLLFLGCPGNAQTEAAQDAAAKEAIARGRIVYTRYCVSCHGKDARGDGPLATELRVPVPDLTTLATRSGGAYPADRVVRIISKGDEVRGHGTADMPAWGPAFNRTNGIEVSVDEAIRNLTRYIGSVQRQRPR